MGKGLRECPASRYYIGFGGLRTVLPTILTEWKGLEERPRSSKRELFGHSLKEKSTRLAFEMTGRERNLADGKTARLSRESRSPFYLGLFGLR